MSDSPRPISLMPVTKLVSRPALVVVDGQLTTVKLLIERKAA